MASQLKLRAENKRKEKMDNNNNDVIMEEQYDSTILEQEIVERNENVLMEEERNLNDDKTVVVRTKGFAEILYSRYTVKVSFTMEESAYESCIL